MPLAEVADRAKIRRIKRDNHHKIVPFTAGSGDPPRRIKAKLFQMLTPEMGHPKLIDHFKEVLAIMRGARNWAEFYEMLDRSLPRFNETLQLPFYDTQAMERLPMPNHLMGLEVPDITGRLARSLGYEDRSEE
jgi:hypothetical protein